MKKITTLILVTILWTVCSAQDSDMLPNKAYKNNFLYLNPLPFVRNTFQINYERVLSSKTGLFLSTGYTLVDSYDDGRRGGNGEIHFRFYLSDKENKVKKLFYFSPYARFQYIETTNGYYDRDDVSHQFYFTDQPDSYIYSYSGGLLFGFKWILKTHLTIDAYFGGGMQFSKLNGSNNLPSSIFNRYGYYTGVLPKIGIQMGYNF